MPSLGTRIAAGGRGTALGHFNVSDLVTLRAVVASARALGLPVLVGVSESEREFMGVRQVAALVASLRDEDAPPVFLNADHTRTLAGAEEAASAGYDAIVYDGSALAFERNAAATRRAVEAAKSIRPEIVVEGEIGRIGTSSQVHDRPPGDMGPLTTADEAREFVKETRVDVLAPAVGNMHGLLRAMRDGAERKRLDVARVAEIREAAGVPLTLHGASGTDDGDLRRAIAAGIAIVHINTEIRVAWRRAVEGALVRMPDQVAPYTLLADVPEAVGAVVRDRLRLFAGM